MTEINDLVERIHRSETKAIAQAISLVESCRADHRQQATALLAQLNKKFPSRIGISGIPGVGKSTFIEQIGRRFLDNPKCKLGAVTVDPSSPISLGSLLGDKTRMKFLASHPRAFVRPSSNLGRAGGIREQTYQTVQILEAAGFGPIIIETVGTGQADWDVAKLVDLFIVLVMPKTGDQLQSMKKGAIELADLILVNKADGPLKADAEKVLMLYQHNLSEIETKEQYALLSSSQDSALLDETFRRISALLEKKRADIQARRKQQNVDWFHASARAAIVEAVTNQPFFQGELTSLEESIRNGQSPFSALDKFQNCLADRISTSR